MRERSCAWPRPAYVDSTGSTNADALAALAEGSATAMDGMCFVAGEQTAGRGRHGRAWVSDPGAGLWSSTIVRSAPVASRIPVLAALAVVDAARQVSDLRLSIKWPNDILGADGRKMAGILVESSPAADAVVVGIGINVDYQATELPHEHSTSWFVESGQHPDRSEVLASLLCALDRRLHQDWSAALADYREHCSTLGRTVRVVLPGGEEFTGTGMDVEDSGHLIVRNGQTMRTVIAGDVIHATIAR